MELPGSEEPFTRKSRYYSSESSDSESDSSGSSSGGSDDGPQRRMSVNAKTVFIQKVGENGLPETVYQVSESSAVEESSQDSSGAIRADETSKSSTVVTAFQINAGVQVQTGGGCATMPAQPGCPFDRAQIIAPPLPDAPPPPLPEDAPPLPTEACEKPAPPPDEAEATNEKQQAAGVGAGASGVVDSDSDGDELDSDVDKMLDASLEERRKAEQVVLAKTSRVYEGCSPAHPGDRTQEMYRSPGRTHAKCGEVYFNLTVCE